MKYFALFCLAAVFTTGCATVEVCTEYGNSTVCRNVPAAEQRADEDRLINAAVQRARQQLSAYE
jgi:hypothetical protein